MAPVLGPDFAMEGREKEGERHEQAADDSMATGHKQQCRTVDEIERPRIGERAEPPHTGVVMMAEEPSDAIDQPQQRTLAVGKVDVGLQALHPPLAGREEPSAVATVI